MEMIRALLTRNVRQIRQSRGWSQEELAEITGYSRGFIADIERGKSWVSPEALEKLCEALGVTCEVLFSSDQKAQMFDMPVSRAVKKIMAIPDDIFDLAQGISPEDDAWEYVRGALEVAQERIKEKKSNKLG
jgi:transcriptional regulator with XRE-family HTH domain